MRLTIVCYGCREKRCRGDSYDDYLAKPSKHLTLLLTHLLFEANQINNTEVNSNLICVKREPRKTHTGIVELVTRLQRALDGLAAAGFKLHAGEGAGRRFKGA